MSNILYDGIFTPNANSEKTFIITPKGEISYLEFTAMTNKLANILVKKGLNPGDRVAVQSDKSVLYLALYAATIKAGCVFLPLNTAYTSSELDYFINDVEPRLVVVGDNAMNSLALLAKEIGSEIMSLNGDETGTLAAVAKNESPVFEAVARNSEDLAAILYTSGTTGKSKGAKLCHRNLLSNAKVISEAWQFTADDILLHMLPVYHTHGLFVAINLLAMVGGSIIFLPKFNVEDALSWMPKSTSMMGIPTFYTRLLNSSDFTQELTDHMRLFISGSAPMLTETHLQFEERTGKNILERYGMTETSMSISNPYNGTRIPGTVGKPLSGIDIRITDAASGQLVQPGDIGVIEQRGDNVFLGYWGKQDETAESFRDDGFFITGDLGREDENGYITIVGRNKDLIISGGLNIYPKEIESVIDEIDDVTESAVIGVPHRDFGEAVVAIIVSNGNTLSDEDIQNHLVTKLAKFKQPKKILYANDLPRNTMGKVQKAELRKHHAKIFHEE